MLYFWPIPPSSLADTPKLPRSNPPPVRSGVDFATLLVLPITAQPQSRLSDNRELWNPPAYNSDSFRLSGATSKCNRHRPVWQRPAAAHPRRTGMLAPTVSRPSANACMAIMLEHARGMSLPSCSTDRVTQFAPPCLELADVPFRQSVPLQGQS